MITTGHMKKAIRSLAGVVLGFVGTSAYAQTSSDLMLKTMPKDRRIEAEAGFTAFAKTAADGGTDFQLSRTDVQGRVRLVPGFVADPRFGFKVNYFDIGSDTPGVPDQLVDTAFALGSGVAQFDSGWVAGMTVGAGYAAAGAFDDGNGFYGLATLIVGREISETDSFGFVIDFDGNRSVFPDFPVPGFQYRKTLDPTILLGIGFPFSSVTWKPNDKFTLDVTWSIPDKFRVDVDYKLFDSLSVFGQLRDETNSFHNDDFENTRRRLFFEQQMVEAGVRFTANDTFSFVLAGGYAFNQSFQTGWDTRETDKIADVSDGVFGRIAVELRY